ncbi:MAG: XrtA system polysaccharide deacetylase [Isosphaeraceae bacterium]
MTPLEVILSFDVESHALIDAARGVHISASVKSACASRVASATSWLLDALAEHEVRATFFVLGEVAENSPEVVKSIHRAGHEVATHGCNHRRVLEMSPDDFRGDLCRARGLLEQLTGEAVLGYRAPTFSVTRRNPWAIDVLVEQGFLYDSSIFPVRHDRYGVPEAPRSPFLVRGRESAILEFPPATLRLAGMNLPVGGGGYFRLFPPTLLRQGLRQIETGCQPAIAMLYFHPWEFDPSQPRLKLRGLRRFRTYVGMRESRTRLTGLLSEGGRFATAASIARRLAGSPQTLASYRLADSQPVGAFL